MTQSPCKRWGPHSVRADVESLVASGLLGEWDEHFEFPRFDSGCDGAGGAEDVAAPLARRIQATAGLGHDLLLGLREEQFDGVHVALEEDLPADFVLGLIEQRVAEGRRVERV